MAWWDARSRAPRVASTPPRSKPRLALGDVFPRLDSEYIDMMGREGALLTPGPDHQPALVVHVDIQFTDPVIRSRFSRSYASSPAFAATGRICRGLVRRIERCSEELITRKDSAALDMLKPGTCERKPQRFEMTFRIQRRDGGEWAERTYRSYQKQPLTVALTKEIILAAHRIIGLFLRRHDENFQWLDSPVPDADLDDDDDDDDAVLLTSGHGHPSLLSVPSSRFVETAQAFEFVPGYRIELSFRSWSPQRDVPTFERVLKINSTQTTPLTLSMSENLLEKALHAINQGLDSKKRELETRLRYDPALEGPAADDDAIEIDLRITNNLGPMYRHVNRNIWSRLVLFKDPEARDCDEFLRDIEHHLVRARNEADAKINSLDDLVFRILELKGFGWTLREPAKFVLGPSASYGRRTIQAALDRIQTGIGDVIRGRNIAIRISAYKRGHLILDKAIVAHEKRGRPKEIFSSSDEEKTVIISRLKARIQEDIDRVFEDTCSIDDIPEDEEDDEPARPFTPAQPEPAASEWSTPPQHLPATRSYTLPPNPQGSAKPRTQRLFSLSRRSVESVRSIDYLGAADDPFIDGHSGPSSAASDGEGEKPAREDRAPLTKGGAGAKPARRSFSLAPRRLLSRLRTRSPLAFGSDGKESRDRGSRRRKKREKTGRDAAEEDCSVQSGDCESMTSREEAAGLAGPRTKAIPVPEAYPRSIHAGSASGPASQQLPEMPSRIGDGRDARAAAARITISKMDDTPETFVDAREFASSPFPAAGSELRPSDALTKAGRPKSADDFSTAPSTPELSAGGSSPRHSILITPISPRVSSDGDYPAIHGSYPESEPEEPGDPRNDTIGVPASKADHDRPTADEGSAGQSDSETTPPQTATPQLVTEGADSLPAAGSPAPIAAGSVGHDMHGAEPTSTRVPPIVSVQCSELSTANIAELESQAYNHNGQLGSEFSAEPDNNEYGPDFPSKDRMSEPSEGTNQGSDLHNASSEDANGLEVPPNTRVGSADGDKLGAGNGAESESREEHRPGGDNPDSVLEMSPPDDSNQEHGTELEAVPSDPSTAGEVVAHGTEPSPGNDENEDLGNEKAPTGLGGPDACDEEPDVGHGLVAGEQEKEPHTAEGVSPRVGPAKQTDDDDVPRDETLNARVTEVKELAEETHGPGFDAEGSHAEPEGRVLDRPANAVEDHPAAETAIETEADSSEPVAAAPDTSLAHSERQMSPEPAAPTDVGAGENINPQAEDTCATDEPKPPTEQPGHGDVISGSNQGIAPEERVTEPELNDEQRPAAAELGEHPIVDATAAAASDAEVTEQNAAEEAIHQVEGPTDLVNELGPGTETGAGEDVPSEPFERDLADELEVQADASVEDIPGFEEPEASKEQPADASSPTQGSTDVAAHDEAEISQPTMVDQKLETGVPECRGDDVMETECDESDREPQPRVEVATSAEEPSGAGESESEVKVDQADNISEGESERLEGEENVGTEPKTPEPQPPEDQYVAEPTAPAEDSTASPPDLTTVSPSPSAQAEAEVEAEVEAEAESNKSAISPPVTTTLTQPPPCASPKAASPPKPTAEVIRPPHLAPMPNLAKLFPAAPARHLPPPVLPQTAGLVGLRVSRFVEIGGPGLRGALGDHRRPWRRPWQPGL